MLALTRSPGKGLSLGVRVGVGVGVGVASEEGATAGSSHSQSHSHAVTPTPTPTPTSITPTPTGLDAHLSTHSGMVSMSDRRKFVSSIIAAGVAAPVLNSLAFRRVAEAAEIAGTKAPLALSEDEAY